MKTLREVLIRLKDPPCSGCKRGHTIQTCYPNRSTDTIWCEGYLDVLESALKAWAGSGLLSGMERGKVKILCESICGQEAPDFESEICWDCIASNFCQAQALKNKLEYEGKIQELQNQIDEYKKQSTLTYCVHCGVTFPVDDEAGTKVVEHIQTCEKHPLFIERQKHKKEVQELQAKIDSMKSSVIVVDFDKHKVDFTTLDELKERYGGK